MRPWFTVSIVQALVDPRTGLHAVGQPNHSRIQHKRTQTYHGGCACAFCLWWDRTDGTDPMRMGAALDAACAVDRATRQRAVLEALDSVQRAAFDHSARSEPCEVQELRLAEVRAAQLTTVS